VFVRAAYHSADAARGISADLLLVDEFQDIAAGDLPVLQETLSHSHPSDSYNFRADTCPLSVNRAKDQGGQDSLLGTERAKGSANQ